MGKKRDEDDEKTKELLRTLGKAAQASRDGDEDALGRAVADARRQARDLGYPEE
ncbi:hypothetical protein ACOQFV_27230 [Nocardiopsis changdeensis]|uniref:Antitoxin n=1 Tax=Nocardiopsis changdeensis TaxID=2831969 RepID=A0ABX8BLT3_9ACTN|nr:MULTISPECIES: hypothetical protein [Nocardiopsis]QUX22962.1 hypothetical protein KGD84_00690 [Nocardiopsis changdeensis]QYX38905.1 hypothetical protein K1J57_10140 [Nocardiopsis sp. MT53]